MAKSKTIEIKVEWHKAAEAPKKNVPISTFQGWQTKISALPINDISP